MQQKSIFLCILVLVLSRSSGAKPQCEKCDYYHFPVPSQCENCCGVRSGIVSSVSANKVVVAQPTSTGGTTETTYVLGPDTKKVGNLRRGARANVYYRSDNKNVATAVELTDALSGLLLPANEPDPQHRCSDIPSGALKLFLGNSVAWTTATEHPVLRIRGEDILTLTKIGNRIAVSAKVFSSDGRLVAQLVDNRWYVNPRNSFRLATPDEHSLAVYDEQGRKVLDVRYLNPSTIRLLGVFNYPDSRPVVIGPERQIFAGGAWTQACFGATGVDIAIQ